MWVALSLRLRIGRRVRLRLEGHAFAGSKTLVDVFPARAGTLRATKSGAAAFRDGLGVGSEHDCHCCAGLARTVRDRGFGDGFLFLVITQLICRHVCGWLSVVVLIPGAPLRAV